MNTNVFQDFGVVSAKIQWVAAIILTVIFILYGIYHFYYYYSTRQILTVAMVKNNLVFFKETKDTLPANMIPSSYNLVPGESITVYGANPMTAKSPLLSSLAYCGVGLFIYFIAKINLYETEHNKTYAEIEGINQFINY